MGAAALVSGGKDSIYSAYLCETQGWPVDELVVIEPADPESPLYHTPNLGMVDLQAKAWGRTVRRVRASPGGPEAEAAALDEAIRGPHDPIVAGAIASSFQWARLVAATYRAGKRLFVPLWGKAARTVVEEEIAAGLDVRLVHLSAEPLGAELLGARLDAPLLRRLDALSRTVRAFHLAGEGGEFETLVVDAPFFRERIVLDEVEARFDRSTHTLGVRAAHLAPKSFPPVRDTGETAFGRGGSPPP